MRSKTMRYLQVVLILVMVIVSSTFTNTISSKEEIIDEIVNHKFENVYNEFNINSAQYNCIDSVVYNEIVYITDCGGLRFFNLNNQTRPYYIFPLDGQNFSNPNVFAKYKDKILINSRNYLFNTIYQMYYENDTTFLKKIFEIDFDIVKMNLTEDKLFLFGYNWYCNLHLLVYDITNINNIELIGNSTIDSSMNEIFMDEKRAYIITEEGNLALYEVRENNQLDFIFEYDFNDVKSVYSNNSHIYTCDKDGLKIYEMHEDKYLKFISYFAIENAKSLFVEDNVIYLITAKKLLTLDQTYIENIFELDKHTMNNRINLEYKRVTVYNNKCIILNEFSYSQHEIVTYSGSLFVFDVSNSEKIVRLFPDKIPFSFGLGSLYLIAAGVFICPIFIVISIILFISRRKNKSTENN